MLTGRAVGDTGLFFYFDHGRVSIEKIAGIVKERRGELVMFQALTLGATTSLSYYLAINHWVQFSLESNDMLGTGLHRFVNFSETPFDPENDIPFQLHNQDNPEIFVWLSELRDLWSIRNVESDPHTGTLTGNLVDKAPKPFLSFATLRDAIHYKLRWIG